MRHSQPIRFPVCPMCNEAVEIKTAKTDHDGKAIHEECYVRSLEAKKKLFLVPPKKQRRIERPA
jgi:uncharacterized protein YlaI